MEPTMLHCLIFHMSDMSEFRMFKTCALPVNHGQPINSHAQDAPLDRSGVMSPNAGLSLDLCMSGVCRICKIFKKIQECTFQHLP